MTSQELKKHFFEYFQSKNHSLISSASLIPENDPTVLFTTAGMHPLVPYLIGEKHPEGKRLVNVQKCVRTGDIEEVGDTTHHTFFEMLGNWSLGDYFKKEAIEYSWEFLTEVLKLDKEKIAVSIFGGNQDVPEYDSESEKLWLSLGLSPDRIEKIKENWWGPAGQTGPCGPDTEMFYWTGKGKAPKVFHESDNNWVEIWNDVIMQYDKTVDDKYIPLKQKNIDTGMGLERTLAVLNGYNDNYLTELWQPIIKQLEKLSGKKYADDKKSFRIVADHLRSAVFLMGDPRGIAPSNKDQGYVLRRLIRRAITFGKSLNLLELKAHPVIPNKKVTVNTNFTLTIAKIIINTYKKDYPELEKNKKFILDEINKEYNKFIVTLQKGGKEITRLILKNKIITAKDLFNISSSYGFPPEVLFEGLKINSKELGNYEYKLEDNINHKFKEELAKHQELSRTASAGKFKGGLVDNNEMATKYHTATHLLHQALKDILGDHVEQRGSNINEERLRFDFTHPNPMTDEEKKKVEDIVNEQIKFGLEVVYEEMSVAEAKKQGAIGLFSEKYGEKIKVYKIGKFSKEICGGPHVQNTNKLGKFSIKKEQSSSAGIRRIKAVLK